MKDGCFGFIILQTIPLDCASIVGTLEVIKSTLAPHVDLNVAPFEQHNRRARYMGLREFVETDTPVEDDFPTVLGPPSVAWLFKFIQNSRGSPARFHTRWLE